MENVTIEFCNKRIDEQDVYLHNLNKNLKDHADYELRGMSASEVRYRFEVKLAELEYDKFLIERLLHRFENNAPERKALERLLAKF